ncbi:MAG: hypothetical protein HY519_02975 [Candidatus Aenigmarchaeota archaeon]|nr:hypothetical protein [Candidatus Aenigmarchaeota archaeon]
MPVVGINFASVEGRKKDSKNAGEININSTPKVSAVKEVTLPGIEQKALAMTFEFVTSYEPDIGGITITGEIFYTGEGNKQLLKKWEKDKKLPEDVSAEILNHLFRRCLIKIANLAEDLQLPPPIQIPRVRPKQQ